MIHLEYIHYRRQYIRCGRKCGKCPHGPYWYAYWKDQGKLRKRYVGKELPGQVLAEVRSRWPELAERLLSYTDS